MQRGSINENTKYERIIFYAHSWSLGSLWILMRIHIRILVNDSSCRYWSKKTALLLLVTIVFIRFLGVSLLYGFYISGIYHEPNCSSSVVTHSVLLVGYGFIGRESDGRKYWLVKNRYNLPKLFIFGVGRRYFSVSSDCL